VTFFTLLLGFSFSTTLWLAVVLPVAYVGVFKFMLQLPPSTIRSKRRGDDLELLEMDAPAQGEGGDAEQEQSGHNDEETPDEDLVEVHTGSNTEGDVPTTTQGRFLTVLTLWPYMVPLFLVYFAEYAMQSGTWAAIGFPVTNEHARKRFYEFANWCYQGGVFVSRSSGVLFKIRRKALWLMPCLQVVLLVLFWTTAQWQYWYDWSLLIPCFISGLLGGAVYVGAFTLIADDIQNQSLREFALSAASIADSIGIICSDISGIFIQRQLYRAHGLSDSH